MFAYKECFRTANLEQKCLGGVLYYSFKNLASTEKKFISIRKVFYVSKGILGAFNSLSKLTLRTATYLISILRMLLCGAAYIS